MTMKWSILFLYVTIICLSINYVSTYEEYSDEEDDEDVDLRKEPEFFDELLEFLKSEKENSKDTREEDEEDSSLDVKSSGVTKLSEAEIKSCNSATCVKRILDEFNKTCVTHHHKAAGADWNYSVDITTSNAKKKTEVSVSNSKWADRMVRLFQILKKKKLKNLSKKEKRIIDDIVVTASTFNHTVVKELSNTMNKMASIYSKGTVFYNGVKLPPGETGVVKFFANNRNCSALTEVWKGWRDATGKKIRPYFEKMVKLLNLGAHLNNYSDYGYFEWYHDFKKPDFNERVMDLYHQLEPHYKEFHAYVRYKLKKKYPDCVDASGPIPAQLLGNVWGQQFNNIFDILKPYPKVKSADVTSALKSGKWTVKKMFKTAESFFSSIGLFNMTEKFWKYSMLKKPVDGSRTVDCHGAAVDMFSFGDFRIKMCTALTGEDFVTVHHEMGHITYFMAYEHQPCTFRDGANSGFHEAIGDTIALSAGTTKHLKVVDLLKNFHESEESNINTLMQQALKKLAFIPYGLLIDSWRWRVFNGTITPDNYNKEWWNLRLKLQGFIPPVPRSEGDFDPGAKYHISHNVPYIRYFVSFIIQFQFYEAMCKASGHPPSDDLFKCDFYQSKEAGKLFKSMLSLGSSQPWPDAMKLITGQPNIKVDSFIKYFGPLFRWMKKYRLKHKYPIGW